MKLRVIRKYQSTFQKVQDIPREKITNKVLLILAFASMLIAGIIVGEAKIKNKVLRDCENTEFTQVYNKQINCTVRLMMR